MRGKVLDFNIQSGEGIISGEDGQRYNFSSSEWRSNEIHPKKNLQVDFDTEDNTATAIYVDSTNNSFSAIFDSNGDANTNMPKLIYVGYLVGLIIPFVTLIGVVMAYVNKGKGPDWVDEHYRYQIRTFWIGLLYFFISGLLTLILIGWIMIFAVIIWEIIRVVKGLKAMGENRAPDNVDSFGI